MRFAILVLLSFFISASLAKRFLQDDENIILGGFSEIDLMNPPSDYLKTLAYIKTHFKSLCHINSNVKIAGVKKASVQIVAGKNYEIVLKVSNHQTEQITVSVFQSLPNNKRQISYSVNSCN